MPGLTFGQLQAALMLMLDIDPAKESTFNGRMKQLARLEMPERPSVGKGVRYLYSLLQLFQIGLTFRLLRAGVPADRSVKIIKKDWAEFEHGIRKAMKSTAAGGHDVCYAFVRHNALTDLVAADPASTLADVATISQIDLHDLTNADPRPKPGSGREGGLTGTLANWAEFWRQWMDGALAIDLDALVISAAVALDKLGVEAADLPLDWSTDIATDPFRPGIVRTFAETLGLPKTFSPDISMRDREIPVAQKFCRTLIG